LRPKIHANELAFSGGIQIGVKHNALSVDHLEYTGDKEIEALKKTIIRQSFGQTTIHSKCTTPVPVFFTISNQCRIFIEPVKDCFKNPSRNWNDFTLENGFPLSSSPNLSFLLICSTLDFFP